MKKYLITTLVVAFAVLGFNASRVEAGQFVFNNGMLFNNGGFVNPQPQPNPFNPMFPNGNGFFFNPFVNNNPFVPFNPAPQPVPVPNGPFANPNPNFNPNGPFAVPVPPVFPQPAPMPVPPVNPGQPNLIIVTNTGVLQNPLNVTVGTQVVWINKTGVPGRVVDPNGVFTSGLVLPNATHTFTFNNPGNFAYKFVFPNGNPMLNGVVVVQ